MNEDIQKVSIDYDSGLNKFIVKLNGETFHFSPQQYMEFVNHSIVSINSIIAEKFSHSLKSFLDETTKPGEVTKKRRSRKTFTKKDCEIIADEVDQWFKDQING